MDNVFNLSSLSDRVAEQDMDELIELLRPYYEDRKKKFSLINKNRIEQLHFTYLVMCYLTQGTDAVVTYDLDEPEMLVGGVYVEGKSLEFSNTEWFARAAEFADNTEICPLVNGNVRITFTFRRLATPVR